MKQKSGQSSDRRLIAVNRLVKHQYCIEERFEAGLVLKGWEVKALRQHHIQIRDSYVQVKHHEAWLIGAHISPLQETCRHEICDATRPRKLLLRARELHCIAESVQRKGYTVAVLDLYLRGAWAKATIALAKGKQVFDQRETQLRQEWQRSKQRILKRHLAS